jgi:hypothetical protein
VLSYRGKRVSAPTRDASLLVLEFDGSEDVIVLNYADGRSRRLWEGARLGSVAETIKQLLDIDHDVRLY